MVRGVGRSMMLGQCSNVMVPDFFSCVWRLGLRVESTDTTNGREVGGWIG